MWDQISRWLWFFTAGLVATGMLSGSAVASGDGAWKVVPSPNVFGQPGGLGRADEPVGGVAATSSTNAWAVGRSYRVERWNGMVWKVVPSPNPSPHDNLLIGVAATSSSNAWAVGYYSNGNAGRTLVERWDGTAWRIVSSPNLGGSSDYNQLFGVAATSSTNAWAVGDYYNGGCEQTLVERWDGKTWKAVRSPNPGGSSHDNRLYGVAATSPANAWAVGYYANRTGYHTLVEHWNGNAWKVVRSPNPGGSSGYIELRSVAATSATNAWAVGYRTGYRTLVEHWDGQAWKVVSSPNYGGSLNGVAATSSTNAWAVGYYSNGTAGKTLVERWNGTAWQVVSSPNIGGSSDYNELAAVAATSANNVWAVGSYTVPGPRLHTLIERWNGTP